MAQNPFVTVILTGARMEPEVTTSVSSTILQLKQGIRDFLNVEVSRQYLDYNEQELQDDCRISDYNFEPISRVTLMVAPYPQGEKFTIRVMTPDNVFELFRVTETMTVEELKVEVERRFGRGECTALTRYVMEMENEYPLSSYYVNKNSYVGATFANEPR